MRRFLHTAVLSLALTSPVVAADLEPIPAEPAFMDWSGFYIGAQIGYGWGDYELEDEFGGVTTTFEEDLNGIIGGGHVGYNFQHDSLVFGIEADIEATGLDGSNEPPGTTNSAEVDINFIGSVRGRLGWAVNNVLLYGTAGWAFGDLDFELSNGTTSEDQDERLSGWTAGAGLEWAVSDQISTRLEYRYTDFGSEGFDSTLFPADLFDVDLSFHAVRVGFSWHF